MRKYLALALTGAMLVGYAGAADAGKTAKPKVIWTDAAGDTGIDQVGAVPPLAEGGFDLVKGTISKKGKDVVFAAEHSAMPASGSLPENFRFLWHFNVGSKEYRLLAKAANIGKPDPVTQSGTDRIGKVDTAGHFRVEECSTDEALPVKLSVCNPIAYITGAFDVAKKTLSINVPMKAIKVKTGSVIAGSTMAVATTSGCHVCWVPEYAERSLTPTTTIDAAAVATTYKIPR